ncbi:polysaccharide biosynthesis tyrosine autokinase [Frigoribacterium sp. VKM Ac-1396]|uniref:polysaccharide biosynthesis tyrosine autokinase n=1 Tax=Frigoribacterium sp. VKM Ac-1396 TaxID=2783821 RepID=UPI00188B1F3F|nr:polysaccharide biosynthesis tyrosine autokinase [Frigoribacterium sp. VKM Ac-1396]MBF4600834.1 polysaccharide biosynthesis tyrosine autokinase [Frigoribacterium sp. VKM Ac-1396]
MDPQHYWRALVKSWPVILVLALLGGAAGYGFAQTRPDSFRATSSVFVSAAEGSDPNELLQGSSYTQNLVQSYTRLATATIVLEPVISDLGLDVTPVQLARQITAENPLNTVIIDVAVVDGDRQRAADIANAVTRSLSAEARSLSPESAAGLSTLSVAPIAEATPPNQPVGPNRRLITLTGLAIGLALGVVLALVRSVVDTRLRSTADVDELRLAPVLGTVGRRRRGSLAFADEPQGAAADDFRRIRAQLQFSDVDSVARTIAVSSVSADDRESRAAVTLDLALAYAERGQSVLVVDADLRGGGLADLAAVSDEVGLTDVVVGRVEFDDAVTPWRDRVDVIATGEVPPNPSPLLSSKSMALFVEAARERYDVVVVDAPGVLTSSDALELGRLTDGVVLVATVGHSSRGQLVQAVRALGGVQVPVIGVILDGLTEGGQRSGGPRSSGTSAKAVTSGRTVRRGIDAP